MIRFRLPGALLLAALAAFAPTSVGFATETAATERVLYYPKEIDAKLALDAALAAARDSGKLAVVVFGADWCHDSQGLAHVLTSAAFANEFGDKFSVTFIDVGTPQIGEGRNLELAARFGLDRVVGTPAMVVISLSGERLNSTRDAASWRNADSRSEADIFKWFRKIAKKR